MKSARSKRAAARVKEAEDLLPKILSPAIRLLKASGVSDKSIFQAATTACRQHANERMRGVSVDFDKFCQLADVVMVWARDPEFIDETGVPKKLSVTGRQSSFERLVIKAGVSVSVPEALKYLLQLQSIRLCDRNRKARLVSHVLLSVTPDRFVIAAVLDEARRFLETLEYNVFENPEAPDGRMQRTVLCDALDPNRFPEAQRFVRQNAQSFLDALDEKLSTCKSQKSARTLRYGAGIYVFVDKKMTKRSARRSRAP